MNRDNPRLWILIAYVSLTIALILVVLLWLKL